MQARARPRAPSRTSRIGTSSAPLTWRPGQAIGDGWRAERRVTLGTTFEVWQLRDAQGRLGAGKIARHGSGAVNIAEDMLRHEHACLAALAHHEGIVAVRTLIDAPVVLVTEWLGGGDFVSLAGAPSRHWRDALRGLVSALSHVHAHGFVHRDVKARNVRFDAHGRVRLIDFASAARCGAPVPAWGTTAEHCRPGRVAGRASRDDDVYALAVLVTELCTGALPAGPTIADAARTAEPSRALDDDTKTLLEWSEAQLERRSSDDARAHAALASLAEMIVGAERNGT